MKKFNKFKKDYNNRFNKDLEFFRSIDENCSINNSILEFFDSEEQKSQWEIPAMQGKLGSDVVDFDKGDWKKYDEFGIFDKLLLEAPFVANFTPMTSQDGGRMVFELNGEKQVDQNYKIEYKAFIDMTYEDDTLSFFFDCYVSGESGLEDDPKKYTMFKDHFTQGVVPLDEGIESLNTNVKRKLDLWATEVEKWTGMDVLKQSEIAQATMN